MQLPLELPVAPSFADDDFLTGAANHAAARWIAAWPEWPEPQLVLHGPPGSGKSHLAAIWRRRSGALNLSADQALAEDPVVLAERAPVLLIDPMVPPVAEAALFHLLNRYRAQGGGLLIVTDVAPARWPVRLADLHSRLAALPTVELQAPDDAVLRGVLIKQCADRQIAASPALIETVLARMERSFIGAAAAIAAIDRAGLAQRRPITLALAREVFAHSTPSTTTDGCKPG